MNPIIRFAAVFLLISTTVPVWAAGPGSSKSVMAYYESSGSGQALRSFYTYINQLPTDTFGIDEQGNISGNAPHDALQFARSKGMQTFATVSNFGATGFEPRIAHAVISNRVVKARSIFNMLYIVKASGYSGVNIDFEAVPRKDRARYSSFVHDVANAMRAEGFLTVVSVPAELKDDPNDSWTGAFNFRSLGRTADILQLMTYDENGPWGAARASGRNGLG